MSTRTVRRGTSAESRRWTAPGELSEHPLGAGHPALALAGPGTEAGAHPVLTLGCSWSLGDTDAEERQDAAWSLRGGLVVQATGLAQIRLSNPKMHRPS